MTRLAIPCASLLLLVAAACNADNPNYGDDGGIDAPNTTCTGSGPDPACPPDNPICSDRRCGGMCTADTECSGRSDGATVCLLPTGDCVACDESNAQAAPGSAEDECRDPTMPVCDATSHTCRACREHSECASGVCDAGACAPAANVIYMKADGADTGDCLTPAEGCLTLHYAKGKLNGDRRFILMAASQTPYDTRDNNDLVEFNGVNQSAHMIGYGATLERVGGTGEIISVKSGAIVRIEGLKIANATGVGIGTGITCTSAAILEIYRARIEDNAHEGINSSGCTLRVKRSRIAGNRGGGIFANGTGSFDVVNNFIVANGAQTTSQYGGLSVSSLSMSNKLEFNTIAENFAASGSPDGITCAATGLVVRNNLITGAPGRPRTNGAVSSCLFSFNTFTPDNAPAGTSNVVVSDLAMFRFVNLVAADYHVQTGSAATGKAQPTGLAADTLVDYDGNPRQEGSTTLEVGADEIP